MSRKHIKDRTNRTQYIIDEQGSDTVYLDPKGHIIGFVNSQGKTLDKNRHILADTTRPELLLRKK